LRAARSLGRKRPRRAAATNAIGRRESLLPTTLVVSHPSLFNGSMRSVHRVARARISTALPPEISSFTAVERIETGDKFAVQEVS
jgi:hypothetical protein